MLISNLNVTNGVEYIGESEDGQIVGTRKEDLLQLYSGNVIIEGSLTVHNLKSDSPRTEVYVNGDPFLTDVENYYWVDDRSQVNVYDNIWFFEFYSLTKALQGPFTFYLAITKKNL